MEQENVYIVIPVYNTEKYLGKCLDSIREQTHQNITVILVDDGSSDRSPQICDEYERKDSRFKVIHKINGGAGSARNVGIDFVADHSGELLMFVDADDWLPKCAVEELVSKYLDTGADWVCGNLVTVFPVRTVRWKSLEESFFQKNENEEFGKFLSLSSPVQSPCGKLYRMHIIIENKLRYDTHLKAGEDAVFNYQYLQYCKAVATIAKDIYYVNRLSTNSTTKKFIPERNYCRKKALVERRKCFEQGIPKNKIPEENEFVLSRFCALIRDYVRNFSKEKAIEKIQETHILFQELLDEITVQEISQEKFIGTKMYLRCEPLFDKGDYGKVYDLFYIQENKSVDKGKDVIKKIMRKIRSAVLFGQC